MPGMEAHLDMAPFPGMPQHPLERQCVGIVNQVWEYNVAILGEAQGWEIAHYSRDRIVFKRPGIPTLVAERTLDRSSLALMAYGNWRDPREPPQDEKQDQKPEEKPETAPPAAAEIEAEPEVIQLVQAFQQEALQRLEEQWGRDVLELADLIVAGGEGEPGAVEAVQLVLECSLRTVQDGKAMTPAQTPAQNPRLLRHAQNHRILLRGETMVDGLPDDGAEETPHSRRMRGSSGTSKSPLHPK